MSQPPLPQQPALPPRERRVRTPTVLQMEAVECGAASLAIVLAYFRRVVPLEELRIACGISRDGSKAGNMARAGIGYGLNVRGFRKEPDGLSALPLPMIVHWEFNHFLVVEGFGKGRVYLNDPAYGPRTVTDEEFDRSFTGLVLTLEPGPEFKPGGQFPSLMGALRRRLVGSEKGIACALLAGICLVVPGLAIPSFAKVFVDRVLVGGLVGWMPALLLTMALLLVLLVGLVWLLQYQLFRMGQKLSITSTSAFLRHVLRVPVEFFTLRYGGDLAARIQLNQQVAQFLSAQLAVNLINAMVVVLYAAVMVQLSVPLTVIGVGIALLNVVALRYVSRRRVDANRRLQQDEGKLFSTSFSGLQMIENIKATGGEDDFFARWAGFQAKSLNAQQELGAYSNFLTVVPILLAALTTAIILAFGGEQVIAGTLSIGALIAFQYLMTSFSDPINKLVELGGQAQEMEANLNRLDDVLKYRVDPALVAENDASEDADKVLRLDGQLELRDVTFGFSRLEPPLIESFNLTVRPGARVALVGGSGSGKSTIAKLVCGLYETWSGEILFDGRPRAAYPRRVMAGSLALVDQEILLYQGSVRDNLTLWDETVPEKRITQAARDASIHADVAARPGAYSSPVVESGANFSGGQRQRLEIARALVGDPAILVLDEATSALDASTEKIIDDNLRRRGCTCLLIAHRLSTIRDADEIIVLEHGKVVQRGTHEQMLAVDGPYAQLIAAE